MTNKPPKPANQQTPNAAIPGQDPRARIRKQKRDDEGKFSK